MASSPHDQRWSESSGGVSQALIRSTVPLGCGVVTMFATLAAVYAIGEQFPNFQIMEWYYKRHFPIGPLVVGVVAGCGYGVGCLWLGERVRISFLAAVVGLQGWAYVMVQYESYRRAQAQGPPAANESFFEYFDRTTRRRIEKDRNGRIEGFVGGLGYLDRISEVLGFTVGGVLVPFALMGQPYCEWCTCYMSRKRLGSLPAGVVPRKVASGDRNGQAAYTGEQVVALVRGRQLVARLKEHVDSERADLFLEVLASYQGIGKSIDELTKRFDVQLIHCKHCGHGALRVRLLSGDDAELVEHEVVDWELTPELIERLC